MGKWPHARGICNTVVRTKQRVRGTHFISVAEPGRKCPAGASQGPPCPRVGCQNHAGSGQLLPPDQIILASCNPPRGGKTLNCSGPTHTFFLVGKEGVLVALFTPGSRVQNPGHTHACALKSPRPCIALLRASRHKCSPSLGGRATEVGQRSGAMLSS